MGKDKRLMYGGIALLGAALCIFSIYNDIVLLYGLGVLLVALALKLTEAKVNSARD